MHTTPMLGTNLRADSVLRRQALNIRAGEERPFPSNPMKQLHRTQSERYSPAERLERAGHPWVVFVIMPLFTFDNAGVDVRTVQLATHPTLALGIAAGLLLGKSLDILAASGLAVRLRLASLPTGLTWRGVAVVSAVAGIGFTMALFVAELAFAGRADLECLLRDGAVAPHQDRGARPASTGAPGLVPLPGTHEELNRRLRHRGTSFVEVAAGTAGALSSG